MKLEIRDFAKIKEADIDIDGITVIAGENNTGKSTVGKILFSVFNSALGIGEKVQKQREQEIEKVYRKWLDGIYTELRTETGQSSYRTIRYVKYRPMVNKIIDILTESHHIGSSELETIITDRLPDWGNAGEELINELKELAVKLDRIWNLPEESVKKELITRYFGSVFNGQMNSLKDQETKACLKLKVKNKELTLDFSDNRCIVFDTNLSIAHQAVYLDNPFILDSLGPYYYPGITTDIHLQRLLKEKNESDEMEGLFDAVLAKEKLEEIYRVLGSVVDGSIIQKRDGDYYLEKAGFVQPVSVSNLSTGLKSFVILKMLLEKGALKEKDVLILDEPEIHLHPQWQITYARLIVLLQKYFDLSIVVTTHSPYFLDAIHLFSVKYEIDNKVNFYLSDMKDDEVRLERVTDCIDRIYQKMASPLETLDTLRQEL